MSAHPLALVAGSSRGIGRAAAVEMARAGYDVVGWYRSGRQADQCTVRQVSRPCVPGTGYRALKELARQYPCCLAPGLSREPDGRVRCRGCGHWYSVSHSGSLLALARSGGPVGIDVQREAARPAAMRNLARMCGLVAVNLTYWAAAEATLKALGTASRRPRPGELVLPADPPSGGRSVAVQPDGSTVVLTTWSWPGSLLAVARLVQGLSRARPQQQADAWGPSAAADAGAAAPPLAGRSGRA